MKKFSTSKGSLVRSLSLISFTFEEIYKVLQNFLVWGDLRFRDHKHFQCLLVSELELPLTSAESVEALPPAPLVRILDRGQSICPVIVVGHPLHPLTPADTNVQVAFDTVRSICHVISEILLGHEGWSSSLLNEGRSRNDRLRDLLANLRRVRDLLDLVAVGKVLDDERGVRGLLDLAELGRVKSLLELVCIV